VPSATLNGPVGLAGHSPAFATSRDTQRLLLRHLHLLLPRGPAAGHLAPKELLAQVGAPVGAGGLSLDATKRPEPKPRAPYPTITYLGTPPVAASPGLSTLSASPGLGWRGHRGWREVLGLEPVFGSRRRRSRRRGSGPCLRGRGHRGWRELFGWGLVGQRWGERVRLWWIPTARRHRHRGWRKVVGRTEELAWRLGIPPHRWRHRRHLRALVTRCLRADVAIVVFEAFPSVEARKRRFGRRPPRPARGHRLFSFRCALGDGVGREVRFGQRLCGGALLLGRDLLGVHLASAAKWGQRRFGVLLVPKVAGRRFAPHVRRRGVVRADGCGRFVRWQCVIGGWRGGQGIGLGRVDARALERWQGRLTRRPPTGVHEIRLGSNHLGDGLARREGCGCAVARERLVGSRRIELARSRDERLLVPSSRCHPSASPRPTVTVEVGQVVDVTLV